MARNIAYIFLMATWVVICSCSDDEKPGIPYELKTSCLVEDETESTEDSLSDNVLYRVTPQQTKSSVLDDAIEVDSVYFQKKRRWFHICRVKDSHLLWIRFFIAYEKN